MSRSACLGIVLIIGVVLAGCGRAVREVRAYEPPVAKDYGRPLPPGASALRKIPVEDYPDFGRGFDNRAGLRRAVQHSLDYLAKESSRRYYPCGDITHERVVAGLRRFLEVLDRAASAAALNDAVVSEFDVYQSVGCDDRGTVYFTGYYCPIFDGRREPDSRFRYPLYGLPPDLVKDAEGHILGQRRPDGGLDSSYPTRKEIESERLLDGHEVAWLADPFEAYVITVQGSAKLRLADGSLYELGYVGNNGRDYTGISEAMAADGVIGRDEISLQTLLRYFAAHPEHVYHYCWKNPRYVFFQEAPGGPFGSLNTPVTPYRTLAVDKDVFPRGALTFVTTTLPSNYGGRVAQLPFAGFGLDQDTGGAIRAAGRCDIYVGIGDEAEAIAGHTGAEGALYYLVLRDR